MFRFWMLELLNLKFLIQNINFIDFLIDRLFEFHFFFFFQIKSYNMLYSLYYAEH